MKWLPGDLDQRITIRRETRVSDGQGGSDSTWADVATVWAGVVVRGGREVIGADRVEGLATYTFGIRYRDDLLESDVIQWQSVNYNIRAIRDLSGRKLYLEIEAERGVAA